MVESVKNESTIREYLLGRVSDETTLGGLEELLFTDEDFCTRVALAEDELVNDYALGYLDGADAESFRATLDSNPDRRFKLQLTRALREKALSRGARAAEVKTAPRASFFDSIKTFFRQPRYAAALALLVVAVLASVVYFAPRRERDELAELREIYSRERPTETRVSGFAYAPLTQTRGAAEERERTRLRRVENDLIEGTEARPGAPSHHALGVFYLTQQKHADAIRQFEGALKFAPRDARLHNDLGAAYFELAKSSPREQRLEALAKGLEEFTAATELDANLPEALFNKSLALQELGLRRQAKESWTLYLQKDSSSPWAEEARRNLARDEEEQTRLPSDERERDERVLADFLAAFRARDDERAEKIHDETKGSLKGGTLPLQLSRRLLLARRRGDAPEADESLRALNFIGDYERERHSDFFFLSWPASTRAPARPRRSDS